jgi:hypothetical protein
MAEEENRLLSWAVEDHLAFDIGFALPGSPILGLRRGLSEDDRRVIARSIVEHFRLCRWQFRLGPLATGHGAGRGGQPA